MARMATRIGALALVGALLAGCAAGSRTHFTDDLVSLSGIVVGFWFPFAGAGVAVLPLVLDAVERQPTACSGSACP